MLIKILCFLLYFLPCYVLFLVIDSDKDMIRESLDMGWLSHISLGFVVFCLSFFLLRYLFNKIGKRIYPSSTDDLVLNKQTIISGLFIFTLFIFYSSFQLVSHRTSDYGVWMNGLAKVNNIMTRAKSLNTKREEAKMLKSIELAKLSGSEDVKRLTDEAYQNFIRIRECIE